LCINNLNIFVATDELPSISDLKNVFELLVKNQFLMNCTSFDTMSEDTEKPKYDLPILDLLAISKSLEGQNVEFSDRKVYWKVNFDRFTQDLR